MARIESLGHVGIYAEDLMKMRDFYSRVLGLTISDEDLEERGMTFFTADKEREHHEFVLMKGRVTSDDAKVIQQISFIVPSLDDLREFKTRLEAEPDVKIERIVSHGIAFGMYFTDPEGNIIELYVRTPYKVPQPLGDAIDIMASTDEELEAIAKARIPAEYFVRTSLYPSGKAERCAAFVETSEPVSRSFPLESHLEEP